MDGLGIAGEPPSSDFPVDGIPKLTVQMVARVQGFPDSWQFSGKKTAAYRQVGNAFPPPVATAVGRMIAKALSGRSKKTSLEHGLAGLPLIEMMERAEHQHERAKGA